MNEKKKLETNSRNSGLIEFEDKATRKEKKRNKGGILCIEETTEKTTHLNSNKIRQLKLFA